MCIFLKAINAFFCSVPVDFFMLMKSDENEIYFGHLRLLLFPKIKHSTKIRYVPFIEIVTWLTAMLVNVSMDLDMEIFDLKD